MSISSRRAGRPRDMVSVGLHGDRGGGAGSTIEERQLAEGVACSQGDKDGLLPIGGLEHDLDRAGRHDVERITRVTLVEDDLTPTEASPAEASHQPRDGLVRDRLEQPAASQRADRTGIVHWDLLEGCGQGSPVSSERGWSGGGCGAMWLRVKPSPTGPVAHLTAGLSRACSGLPRPVRYGVPIEPARDRTRRTTQAARSITMSSKDQPNQSDIQPEGTVRGGPFTEDETVDAEGHAIGPARTRDRCRHRARGRASKPRGYTEDTDTEGHMPFRRGATEPGPDEPGAEDIEPRAARRSAATRRNQGRRARGRHEAPADTPRATTTPGIKPDGGGKLRP